EGHHVTPEWQLVVARSSVAGANGNWLQGVVILQHGGQWRGLPGELECVEYVGQSVGEHDRGAIADLEMQVRAARGAGTAHVGDMVSACDTVARAYRDAVLVQVGVDGEAPVTDVDHHPVAA